MIFLLFFSIYKLLKPAHIKPNQPCDEDFEIAKKIAYNSHDIFANLVLLKDKYLLINKERSAFIMYGVSGRSWIAMGDPVGDDNKFAELIWEFRELSKKNNGWTVFYEIRQENLHIYIELGLSLFKIGEEAKISLQNYNLEGKAKSGLRYIYNRLNKEGYKFEIVNIEEVPNYLIKLKEISNNWLKIKKAKEKKFSLDSYNEEYLKNFPIAIIKNNQDDIIAFSNL